MTEFIKIDRSEARPAPQPTLSARQGFWLDPFERVVVFILIAQFLVRFIPTVGLQPYNILLMFSEGLSAGFILVRRRGETAATIGAWIAAFVGTFAPLLAVPGGAMLSAVTGVSLMFAGLTISISAKIVLRRSFGIVAANRGVRRGGPYSLVRHPMYFGYLLTHIGFLAISFMAANVAIYVLCWTAMVFRIRAEEDVLLRDPAYRDYAREVRWRLLPGIW